jgi:hypothetical protein
VETQQDGKMLSGCCGDLCIVEISGGAVTAYKSASIVTHTTRDYMTMDKVKKTTNSQF